MKATQGLPMVYQGIIKAVRRRRSHSNSPGMKLRPVLLLTGSVGAVPEVPVACIVRSVIDLGRNLGLKAVAEGAAAPVAFAALMELKGESVFKAIAFSKVSRIIRDLTTDIRKACEDGTLKEIEGLGESSCRTTAC